MASAVTSNSSFSSSSSSIGNPTGRKVSKNCLKKIVPNNLKSYLLMRKIKISEHHHHFQKTSIQPSSRIQYFSALFEA